MLIDKHPLPWSVGQTADGTPVIIDSKQNPLSVIALPCQPYLAEALAGLIVESINTTKSYLGKASDKYFKCGKCNRNYGTTRNANCFWCRYQKGRFLEPAIYKRVVEFESWASIATPQARTIGLKSIKKELAAIGADVVALKRVNSGVGPFYFVVIDNEDR